MSEEKEKFICENCHNEIDEGREQEFEGNYYCEDCYSDLFCDCEDCGRTIWAENSISVDGGDRVVCERCHNNYFICPRCDYEFHQDDGYYSEILDNIYCCEECRGMEEEENHSCYHQSGTTAKFRDLKNKRLVGVEIEAECGSGLELPKELRICEDGSLDNTGVEVVLPPSNGKSLANFLSIATKGLKDSGYKATENCGLHVHFEFNDDRPKIKKLFVAWLACQSVFYSLVSPSRRNNNYCKQYDFTIENAKKIKSKMIDYLYYKEFGGYDGDLDVIKGEHYAVARYYGLNLHSIFYRGTIEFRLHNGTIDKSKIMNWIKLLDLFIDFALKGDSRAIKRISDTSDKREKMLLLFKQIKAPKRLRAFYIQRFNKFNQ